jgi:SSS family solute:Na+ symporter
MLNAASTIFSMDVFRKYVKPDASQRSLVFLGRVCVVVFTGVAIFVAPKLGNPNIRSHIFHIIQESQGFISPGVLAVFVFGFVVRRGPPVTGVVGLLTNVVAYGFLMLAWPELQFLNRMVVCFWLCIAVMLAITWFRPLPEPVQFKQRTGMNLEQSRGALAFGIFVIILTVILYVLFSPLVLAR